MWSKNFEATNPSARACALSGSHPSKFLKDGGCVNGESSSACEECIQYTLLAIRVRRRLLV